MRDFSITKNPLFSFQKVPAVEDAGKWRVHLLEVVNRQVISFHRLTVAGVLKHLYGDVVPVLSK